MISNTYQYILRDFPEDTQYSARLQATFTKESGALLHVLLATSVGSLLYDLHDFWKLAVALGL